MAVEHRLRGRAHGLADLLILAELSRHRRIGDREIVAVAGAHAERPIGVAHGAGFGRVVADDISGTEETLEEAAAAVGIGPILRPAIVLPERGQDGAALPLAVGAVALDVLEIGERAVEIGPRLLDLVVDRPALLRLSAEQGEE